MRFDPIVDERRFAGRLTVAVGGTLLLMIVLASQPAGAAPADPLDIVGAVAAEFPVLPASQVAVIQTPVLNTAALRVEDETREAAGEPPRFAVTEDTWLTPGDSGTWEELDDRYLLWRLRISAAGALSLNLGFTGYFLPPGARLSIYPVDVTGPGDSRGVVSFTNLDNEDHGQLWTPVILADDIVVELVLPRAELGNYRLELTAINRGYRYFGEDLAGLDGGDKSGGCNIDVACPAGDGWRREIASVGVISTGGSTFCTGVLLNNTAQDGRPYFLTANHCRILTENAASLVVYWNFQSPDCGEHGGGRRDQFSTGAIFLAGSATSDFTLVELDDEVDPAFGVSFAGWDHSDADPVSATGIHHPRTNEKSISFEYDPTTTTSYLQESVPGDGSHIRITDWDVGTTEPGSSGSPLFDQDHHVVGQLHGGYAACRNDESDWYGRFSVSWPAIAQYLDPLASGQTSLDTYAPGAVGITVSGATLAGAGKARGPFTPSGTAYTVKNIGRTPLEYRVLTDVNWVDVAGSNGTLAAGASTTVTVAYNAAAAGLGDGLHVGTLRFVTSGGTGEIVRQVRLQVGTAERFYSFDLATDPGWEMGGDWAYGVPLGRGGQHGYADPTAGFTGEKVLGYNLAGDYAQDMPPTDLETQVLDCSELSATSLRFRRWLNVEEPAYDHASIAVSNDGVNFTAVWANEVEITDHEWVPVSYDISAVADHQATVYIKWSMGATDWNFVYSGWNLDDVEIWGVRPTAATPDAIPGRGLNVENFPNPFNPSTVIQFELAHGGPVRVGVYDVQGRLVRELFDGSLPAGPGRVVWRGLDQVGLRAASGVYLARVMAGGQRAEHKMILLQ